MSESKLDVDGIIPALVDLVEGVRGGGLKMPNQADIPFVESTEKSGEQYTCAACGKTFESEWSHEEAMAESKALFGKFQPDELAVICDDCFQRQFR